MVKSSNSITLQPGAKTSREYQQVSNVEVTEEPEREAAGGMGGGQQMGQRGGQMGQQQMGQQQMGKQQMGQQQMGQQQMGQQQMGQQQMGQQQMGKQQMGQQMGGRPPMGGQQRGGAPMGGAPRGGPPMGGAPMGGPPMGGAPMGAVPMAAAPPPPMVMGAPIGIQCLAALDHIVVQQQVEMLEVLTGYETANRYMLTTGANQVIFYAAEESSPWERQTGGKSRRFLIHVLDMMGAEIVRCNRPNLGCCGCDDSLMAVECPPGTMVAGVLYKSKCCTTEYHIVDAASMPQFLVRKNFGLGGEVTFTIYSMNGGPVGAIVKKYGGFMKEMLTDADTFVINWPIDMPIQLKAALIGATFLIDFQEFENNEGAGHTPSPFAFI